MRFSLRVVMFVVFIILMFYYVAYLHLGLQIPMKIDFSRAPFQTLRSEEVSLASTKPHGMCGGVWGLCDGCLWGCGGCGCWVFEFVFPSNYYYYFREKVHFCRIVENIAEIFLFVKSNKVYTHTLAFVIDV